LVRRERQSTDAAVPARKPAAAKSGAARGGKRAAAAKPKAARGGKRAAAGAGAEPSAAPAKPAAAAAKRRATGEQPAPVSAAVQALAAGAAGKNLMIVESPAKARTLGKLLPRGFVVLASVGHVRDLPKNDLGVDIDRDFEPHYVSIRGKANVLRVLKQAAAKARAVYLAPDPDREGEAIAWHLAETLRAAAAKAGAAPLELHRLTFNEITQRAVRAALEQPRDLDMDLVNAQQARRVLDRLVGYKVSPFLWQTVRYGLSAGRVQSVALRLIAEREKEIRAFEAVEYWSVEAELATERDERFAASLHRVDERRVGGSQEGERLAEAEARALAGELRGATATVSEVREQERRRNPSPPFITSTLQQEAFKRYRFSSQRTMAIAQQLYEGLDIGREGAVGLITYMRTDSTRLAAEAVAEIREVVARRFGPEYLPETAPRYAKRDSAQDAHEAVRPTLADHSVEDLKQWLTPEQAKLYALVWARAVASQMSPARDLVTTVDVGAGRLTLRASGTVPVFAGFRKVWGHEDEEAGARLPRLVGGQPLRVLGVRAERHETQPPPRYTEGTLVKALEELGIGRPSTYATIIGTITTRDYVSKERGKLAPTDLGMTVSDLLTERFADVFEVPFTAQMEEGLDRVENGELEWHELVRRFYGPFSKDLERAEAEREQLKRDLEVETDIPCERCGRKLVRKFGRHGPFLACPGYPECKFTRPVEEAEAPQALEEKCPQCGAQLVLRTGRYGRFVACSRYPDCKYTRPMGLGIACPEPGCGGELVERRSRRGKPFFGCNRYPECKFATWDRPVAIPCPRCQAPFLVRKSSKKKGDYLRCLRCRHEQAGEAG
jgi:DNA topoisomerase-1